MSRSVLVTTLLSFALLTPIGCAVPADGGDDAVTANAALEAPSSPGSLVGTYYDHVVPAGGIARLSLESDGTYDAEVEANGTVLCVRAPCLIAESGTWTSVKTARGTTLRLDPSDASGRAYEVKQLTGRLELSIAGGKTQQLIALGDNQCLDDADCDGAANLECAPKICMMFCASSDPFCCGPSTCRAKIAH